MSTERFGNPVSILKFRLLPSTPAVSADTTPGFVFFSPAVRPNNGVQIDVSSVSIVSYTANRYRSPSVKNGLRPFVLGPEPASPSGRAWPPDFSTSYKPVLNSSWFGLTNNKTGYAIRGILTDTGTMETQIVLV
jgi:hypothetical protein